MAKNLLLKTRTAEDIDKHIERILRGLGNPEPPLLLQDVRELLKLDLGFYKADDPGLIRETISRIRIAGIQLFERPTLLLDAIQKYSLRALYIPDQKRILLDGNLPEKKHRWNVAHEIGHSVIPWHESMLHGDNKYSVTPECHEQIEAEANYAAGQLLFFRERFAEEALSLKPTIASVKKLHQTFGNTLSTTLYRFVESFGEHVPIVGIIAGHPHHSKRSSDFDPLKPCRHVIQSRIFQTQFSSISEKELFDAVSGYCGPQRGGPLGSTEMILSDDNGQTHRFYFETFFNRYDSLTLGVHLQREPTKVGFTRKNV